MNFLLIKVMTASTNCQKQPCNWKQCLSSPNYMWTVGPSPDKILMPATL